ncbi:hypothetical protein L226DRAFT_537584 [Lentinus tigrinus ALCF2SS1-7]|uniref:DUF1917-domain-containing protein n=1 Tax=Lentinus tigrinus ALCF2SS1-6 TaxID=1328759 RepID=A0A5C2S4I5_9APHY|nr:hypothetical protein L227DRAFT_594622 [Lentinus tigrinus ALCF2SS1-6]RPD71836.1 hypothetical protein L226DRAFT_537584 [Lentinus tigrinus ALCF2SS1-7]
MSKDDDFFPEGYTYKWTPKSDTTLQEFLAKYKPSMVQNDGTKPWLWVAKAEQPQEFLEKGAEAAIKEANEYLADVTERVQKIQHDDSIPVRSNKKKGLKSKKELREEVQHEATGKLKEISVKHGYVCGKWLIFATPDKVDMIWSSIAHSLVSGPLSSTSAFLAKVATSPQNDTANYSHLICVYMPDVYDQGSVTEVMKVLLRNHGLNLMGVKTDLYTSIGIDSKHPSGVSSTVWKNTALMKDSEIKQLKDEYFSELSTAKSAAAEEAAAKKTSADTTAKAKPKLKKKAGADDPFASDDDEDKEEEAEKPAPPSKSKSKAKAKKPAPKKKAAADAFASDDDAGDDDEGEEARKAEVKAKKKPAPKKRKSVESDEESDEAPKKKRGRA